MSGFTVVHRGPWRIRTSGIGENRAVVSYCVGAQTDTVLVETHTDLALLRDAITEYLTEAEAAR